MLHREEHRSGIQLPTPLLLFLLPLVLLILLSGCKGNWLIIGLPPTSRFPPPGSTATAVPVTVTGTPTLTLDAIPPPPTSTWTATPSETETPSEPTPTGTATATLPANHIINGDGHSQVEQAVPILESQVDPFYLIIVSSRSTGVEADIYRDLRLRFFRTTTGPDEGIDTHTEFCYPSCIFVLAEEVNAIPVSSWLRVLMHEYRHIIQAKNNPTLAQDFRDPGGTFTSYGAFSEACADYGLNVAPVYHAQVRIDQLKRVLGPDDQALIDQACRGDKIAYGDMVEYYVQKVGQGNAFEVLFPRYR